jgi:hypothetical protein
MRHRARRRDLHQRDRAAGGAGADPGRLRPQPRVLKKLARHAGVTPRRAIAVLKRPTRGYCALIVTERR